MTALLNLITSFLIATNPNSNTNNADPHQKETGTLDVIVLEEDSVKTDTLGVKKEIINYAFSGETYFGKNNLFGFNGNLRVNVEPDSNIEFTAFPYMHATTKNNEEKARLGILTGFEYGDFGLFGNIDMRARTSQQSDSSFNSKTEKGLIQNGAYSKIIDEQDFSNQDIDDKGSSKGLDLRLNGLIFQIGNDGGTIVTEDNTENRYHEVYGDSTNENQGQIITRTNLVTNIITNVHTRVKNKDNKNSGRFEYKIVPKLKDINLNFRLGTVLENHTIDNEIRNSTNIVTDINGQTIIRIEGNQTYLDTIPISSHKEENRSSLTINRTQINTDYLNLLAEIGKKDKSLIYRVDFDKCFFRSNGALPWYIEQTLNSKIMNVDNALRLGVGDRSIGGGLTFVANILPKKLAKEGIVNDYLLKKRDIDRNISINNIYKNILRKYNDVDFTRDFWGPFAEFDIEKTYGSPSQWDIKTKIGYSAIDWATWLRHDYNSFKNSHKFSGSFVYRDLAFGAYFKTDKDGNSGGLEMHYVPGPGKKKKNK